MLHNNPILSGVFALTVLAAVVAPASGEDMLPVSAGEPALDLGQGLLLVQDAAHPDPYYSLLPAPPHVAVAHRVGGLTLRFGLPGTGLDPSAAGYPEANSGLIGMSGEFGNAALSVSMSQMRDVNTYAGAWPASSLALRTTTSAVQLAGAYRISPTLAIAGQAAYGLTPATRSTDSLAAEISRARTNAFSFGLVAADRVRRGDRLSVSLSQPMRTYSGRIAMDVLPRSVTRGAAGERLVFSMVPLGREMRAQLNYQMPAGYGAIFGMTLMARRNPNNLDDASVETLIAVRYVKPF